MKTILRLFIMKCSKFNKENSTMLEASFLDLQIKIENGKMIIGLFDKKDNFPFECHTNPVI